MKSQKTSALSCVISAAALIATPVQAQTGIEVGSANRVLENGIRCNDTTHACEALIYEAAEGSGGTEHNTNEGILGILGRNLSIGNPGAADSMQKMKQMYKQALQHDVGSNALGSHKVWLRMQRIGPGSVRAVLHDVSAEGQSAHVAAAIDAGGKPLKFNWSCDEPALWRDQYSNITAGGHTRCGSDIDLGTMPMSGPVPQRLQAITITTRTKENCCERVIKRIRQDIYGAMLNAMRS